MNRSPFGMSVPRRLLIASAAAAFLWAAVLWAIF
jgi:hypothetical protein